MKFEFKLSENSTSFREYLAYLIQTSQVIILHRKTMLPIVIILIFSAVTFPLSGYYKVFPYMLIAIIGALIFYILVILLIMKIMKKN